MSYYKKHERDVGHTLPGYHTGRVCPTAHIEVTNHALSQLQTTRCVVFTPACHSVRLKCLWVRYHKPSQSGYSKTSSTFKTHLKSHLFKKYFK